MQVGLLMCDDWANFAYDILKSLQAAEVDAIGYKLNRHIFGYSEQLPTITPNLIKETYKDCDVVIMVHSDWELTEYLDDQTIINFATGTKYRQNYHSINQKFTSPFTLIALPEFQYLAPNPKYLVGAIEINKPVKPLSDKLVVGHFPSNPSVKGTNDIIRIVNDLKKQHDFDFVCSSDRVSHEENLERMNNCDIYVELLASEQGGKPYGSFGISALEAAALGKIVITQAITDNGLYNDTYGINMMNMVINEDGLRKTLSGLLNYKGEYIIGQQNLTRDMVKQHHSHLATGNKLKEYLYGL